MTKNNLNHSAKKYLIQLEPVFMTLRHITDAKLAVNNTKDNTNLGYLQLLETKLHEAMEQAKQADKIKTEFVQNIQHSIRTPFNGVWGLASILYEQEADPQKKEYLSNITECAKELLDYCNVLLDFSKSDAGLLPVIAKKFNLKEVINKVVTKTKPAARCKGLRLVISFEENMPETVIGDDHRLHEILIHLVNNAIKFTDKGFISLTVKPIQKNKNQEIILQFIVKDSGLGIPEEKQQYVYEQFARLIPANKGTYKGLGLGLTIVKQFMQDLGGEIEVKSHLRKGSTFTCTIPFKMTLTKHKPKEKKHEK